jgi:hypothetical protein
LTNVEERSITDIGMLLMELKTTAVFHKVVESKDAVDAVAIPLLFGMMNSGGDPSLVRPILDRWLTGFLSGQREQQGLSRLLIWAFQRTPADHDDKASKDLLRSLDDGRLQPQVIDQMGWLRWPEFQNPLGERARNGNVSAVKALGGYMDDRTVEYLLEAVGRSSNEEFRKACLDQLDSIRRYQTRRRAGRSARAASRRATRRSRSSCRCSTTATRRSGPGDPLARDARRGRATSEDPPAPEGQEPGGPSGSQQALDRLNAPREAKKP